MCKQYDKTLNNFSKNSTKWFDSFDYSYSMTNNPNENATKMTTQPDSSRKVGLIDMSNRSKADSDVNPVLTSSLSASQISSVPRNLGAIPKTASSCTNHRSMRKLSFGEEQYPNNKMYSRTLSQRSTSDRIPENNAIHQTTSIFNNRVINNMFIIYILFLTSHIKLRIYQKVKIVECI